MCLQAHEAVDTGCRGAELGRELGDVNSGCVALVDDAEVDVRAFVQCCANGFRRWRCSLAQERHTRGLLRYLRAVARARTALLAVPTRVLDAVTGAVLAYGARAGGCGCGGWGRAHAFNEPTLTVEAFISVAGLARRVVEELPCNVESLHEEPVRVGPLHCDVLHLDAAQEDCDFADVCVVVAGGPRVPFIGSAVIVCFTCTVVIEDKGWIVGIPVIAACQVDIVAGVAVFCRRAHDQSGPVRCRLHWRGWHAAVQPECDVVDVGAIGERVFGGCGGAVPQVDCEFLADNTAGHPLHAVHSEPRGRYVTKARAVDWFQCCGARDVWVQDVVLFTRGGCIVVVWRSPRTAVVLTDVKEART
eukprot:3941819-Rhodomonas_salina.1